MSSKQIDNMGEIMQEAIMHHRNGKLKRAGELYDIILRKYPDNPDVLNLKGILYHQTGDNNKAEQLIKKAISLNPGAAAYHNNLGNLYISMGQTDNAIRECRKSLKLNPNAIDALYTMAKACLSKNNYADAEKNIIKFIQQRPDHIEGISLYLEILSHMDRVEEALNLCNKTLHGHKNREALLINIADVLMRLKKYEVLVTYYNDIQPAVSDFAPLYFNRGNALSELGRADEALVDFDRAIELKEDYYEAYFNRGNVLYTLGRLKEAIDSYDRSTQHRPDFIQPYLNKAKILCDLGRPDDALECCDTAIRYRPALAAVHYNRGEILKQLGRTGQAIESYDTAIKLQPDYIPAYINKSAALIKAYRPDEALACIDRAIHIGAETAELHVNRGHALLDMRRFDEAYLSYYKALSINPDLPYIHGLKLHCKMQCCDWADLEYDINFIQSKIESGSAVSSPFYLLSTPVNIGCLQKCAKIYINKKYSDHVEVSLINDYYNNKKIRIGYFSADYYDHATANLISELIELHDRNKFEIIAFSFSPDTKDDCQKRLVESFDEYYDVNQMSDTEVAVHSRSKRIDIAVDLKGITSHCRTAIFKLRAAPIQVNYLGYPGTIGADYIEYIIADPVLIPDEYRQYYNEKIVYLPDSYQPNDSRKLNQDPPDNRKAYGLPEDAFIYCCFNNSYKITPDIFNIWMRILKSVDNSVLWLMDNNTIANSNLRKEAEKSGVDPGRLIFAPRMELHQHLSRTSHADLFLDTFYYNAHTTASDALSAGVPVLTCPGETFSGRVAASLLNAVNLRELISDNADEYEKLAVELSSQTDRLAGFRQKLRSGNGKLALFDTKSYTRNLERAYMIMHDRYKQGKPPDHIFI